MYQRNRVTLKPDHIREAADRVIRRRARDMTKPLTYNAIVSVRAIARELGTDVPHIHKTLGCRGGNNCTGPGCNVGKRIVA